MAVRIAIANPKGGVGKSTTTMMVAEGLALRVGARVLVLDMDPQAMVTKILIGQQALYDFRNQGQGLGSVLRDWSMGRKSNLSQHIVSASDIIELRDAESGGGAVDLVPSSPELLRDLSDLQTLLARIKRRQRLDVILATLFERELARVGRRYHVILLDCPAGPVPLALTSIRLAQHLVVPTNLEENSYSTLVDFLRLILDDDLGLANKIRVHILITMYQSLNPLQRQMLDHITAGSYDLNAIPRPIPYSTAIQRAQMHPGVGVFRTAREKYEGALGDVLALADTMFERLELEHSQ
jgi:cellulose biosynthesis protein BcsQ